MPKGKRKKADKVGLQVEFEKHSSSIFSGMKARAKKQGRDIPFTLRELRNWLISGHFAGSWDNTVQCAHCFSLVNAMTFVVDHRDPVKYGGSFDLDNLDVVCSTCNNLKGVMSASGFRSFMAWTTANLQSRDLADVFGRMKNGAGFMRLKIMARNQSRTKTSRNFSMPRLLRPK